MPKNINDVLADSLKTGWLTTGPKVKQFEQELQSILNSKYVISVNSCTAALHLALAAKGFGRGDKFIAPSYTFVATVEVGEYLGMEPILIDCNENDFNMDLNKLQSVLKKIKISRLLFQCILQGNQLI